MQESVENTLPKLIHPGHRLILASRSIMTEIMCLALVYEASWTPGHRVIYLEPRGQEYPITGLDSGLLLLYQQGTGLVFVYCRRSGARGEGAVFMTWRTIYHPLAHFAARVLMSKPFSGMGRHS